MSRHRDFDAARAEADPLTFTLGGEQFTARATMPAGVLLDIANAHANGDELELLKLVGVFIEQIVPDEDHDRFVVAMRLTDQATVFDLVAWVIEETTGRPFGKPSSSPQSPASGGESSKDASLSWAAEARSA